MVKESNFKIQDYFDDLSQIDLEMSELKKQKKVMMTDLVQQYGEEIYSQLNLRGEPFGTVNLTQDGIKINFQRKKKVVWDQEKLEKIYNQIKDAGKNPNDYIKVSYDVSETLFKEWSNAIVDVFEPAREVQNGGEEIKLKRIK